MKKQISTSVSQTVLVDVDVDIDLDDLVQDLDFMQLRYIAQKKGLGDIIGAEGDPTADRIVEDAYRAALAMADCPQAIRDLLWKVHGRAI